MLHVPPLPTKRLARERSSAAKPTTIWASSDLDVCCVRPRALINPLHHRLQLLHGSTLIELCHSAGDHALHAHLPEHRLYQLIAELFHKVLWIRARPEDGPGGVLV